MPYDEAIKLLTPRSLVEEGHGARNKGQNEEAIKALDGDIRTVSKANGSLGHKRKAGLGSVWQERRGRPFTKP